MGNGKVAIVMCCYNHGKYVGEAIETVINQTYENWEFWIANDGSTDNSAEVISSYKDSRIHFVDFKENTKLVGAQSYLLEQVKNTDCDYIVNTCADDKWKLDKLEKQVELLNRHKEYAACLSWDEFIFEVEKDSYMGLEDYSHKKNRSKYDWAYLLGLFDNCINADSVMVRKDIYFSLGGYNQYFIRLGDYRLWLSIALRYPIYMIEEPLVYYRRHGSNISIPNRHTTLGTLNEMFVVKKEMFDFLSEHDFYRTFFRGLLFAESGKKENFFADKVFLLLSSRIYAGVHTQIASELWLENSPNPECMKALEERYGLNNYDLEKLNANGGIGAFLVETFDIKDVYSYEVNGLENQFLKYYQSHGLNCENIFELSWNGFFLLGALIKATDKGEALFNKIKEEAYLLRMGRIGDKQTKIMHIICRKDLEDQAVMLANDLASEYKVYVSPVYKKEEYFLEDRADKKSQPGEEYSGVNYIDIFDPESCGLSFDNELGIDADIVWYLGCLGDDYECTDMIRGYGLNVSQMAMIDRKDFADQEDISVYEMVLDSVDFLE